MRDDELAGCALADVLERLEAGKIGHRAAMDWLDIDSYAQLVEIVHANGRRMPGHRDMVITPQTRAVIRQVARPPRRVP